MPSYSYLFAHAPHWSGKQNFRLGQLSPRLQSWINEPNSLTQRLRTSFGNHVRVSILFQGWQKPFVDEARALKIPASLHTLVREVLLHIDETPLVLARSIIPQATIAVAQRNLSHLGNRPLGEVIFSYPNLQRLKTEITHLNTEIWTPTCQERFDLTPQTWGRRTIYAIPTQAMLVSEFFLAPLFCD